MDVAYGHQEAVADHIQHTIGAIWFIKMPFGLNQLQYFFQYYMDLHFDSINDTTNVIADDTMIHSETDQQHEKHLIQVLNKCIEIGLKLNQEKCVFAAESVQFYGNIVGCQGLQPDPKKVDVIMRMPAPTSKTELLFFLGMCNYLLPYIPRLSDMMSTLHELTIGKAEFIWDQHYN